MPDDDMDVSRWLIFIKTSFGMLSKRHLRPQQIGGATCTTKRICFGTFTK
jgi:hypothetical protein